MSRSLNSMISSLFQDIPYWFVCGSFQLVSHSSVVFPSFFVDIHPLPNFIRCIDHFLCNRWLPCFLVDFPNQVTNCICHTFNIVSLHFHISTFIFDALKFSSRASCPSSRRACNFSRSHLGFPLWNVMIFFNTMQIFANSKLWPELISVSGIVSTYTLAVFFLDTTEVHS